MKTINTLFINIFFFLLFLLLQACSTLDKHSTFMSTANPAYIDVFSLNRRDSVADNPVYSRKNVTKKIYSEIDYLEVNKGKDTQKSWMIPDMTLIFIFESSDSTVFGIEVFSANKLLFIGPPFIPIIPNPTLPWYYKERNKDYHILIKSQSDTATTSDLTFYRNKEKIIPQSVNEIKFSDNLYRGNMYIITESNSTTMYPQKYYLFTFNLKKLTTKEIEIRKKEEIIFQIKRKQKWEYRPFDFSVH